ITVSWKENPTPSRASTIRREREFSVWMSRSVPAGSFRCVTIMFRPFLNGGEFGADHFRSGLSEDMESFAKVLFGDRQRRHDLHDFVRRSGGLHAEPVGIAFRGDLARVLRVGEEQTGEQAAAADGR